MLLGRGNERRQIAVALEQARTGTSAAVVFVGEPGIGKTALLEYAATQAHGMEVLRARGVESEAEVPFGSLFELLRPALEALERIPVPQARALEAALALRPGRAEERFAVGAATLSLLAAYAERHPVVVLIDDAHWLDLSSAAALRFAIRRLMADPVAVLATAREGERSLLDDAAVLTLHVDGLTPPDAARLLPDLSTDDATRLHAATAGNPLALLELATDAHDLDLVPAGAPLLVSARISEAFLRRAQPLAPATRQALVLAALSDTGDLAVLQRAADQLGIDLAALGEAETAGLVTVQSGVVGFRHPLARSAIYAAAPGDERRRAHRAIAAALPDRDFDRRAWHLAAAAIGVDEAASSALEQAATRATGRSAYAAACSAFERAARLSGPPARRAVMFQRAAEAAWLAGQAERATALLDDARAESAAGTVPVEVDWLAGRIAAQCGPVTRGRTILVDAAERAGGELSVEMLAEAVGACFLAGNPAGMIDAAARAAAMLPQRPSPRTAFLATIASGMADVVGGDAAQGTRQLRSAVAQIYAEPRLRDDLHLLPWLAIGPIFLRERNEAHELIDGALATARARAAVGVLPYILNLIARDQATTDQWPVAESTYREAIELARESGQRTQLSFALAGLAWLQARRGREHDCRVIASEALALVYEVGARLHAVWATAALGDLELGLGDPAAALEQFLAQERLLSELEISDPDLSPAAEQIDALLRLGELERAQAVSERFAVAARAKAQPWSLARAVRSQAMVQPDGTSSAELFGRALALHGRTLDTFEYARTHLAYGERLRRDRHRVRARDQLRAALQLFEGLDARPWAERARRELEATGETVRSRDVTAIDELTARELQIALLLGAGQTTRQAAAALFLSPKTVEYHLRHIYLKLGISSRVELAVAAATLDAGARGPRD